MELSESELEFVLKVRVMCQHFGRLGFVIRFNVWVKWLVSNLGGKPINRLLCVYRFRSFILCGNKFITFDSWTNRSNSKVCLDLARYDSLRREIDRQSF